MKSDPSLPLPPTASDVESCRVNPTTLNTYSSYHGRIHCLQKKRQNWILAPPIQNDRKGQIDPLPVADTPSIQKTSSLKRSDRTYVYRPLLTRDLQFASHTSHYPFTNTEPRDKDAFGLETGACLMLVPVERFQPLVAALSDSYAPL